jgi:hypothetical protein
MANNEAAALFNWKIAHMGGFFVGPVFYHMISVLCGTQRKKMLYFAYSQATIFTLIGFGTELIFHQTRFVFGIFFNRANPLYVSGVIFYLFFVIFSYYELLRFLPQTKGFKRLQTLYIIFGFMFGFLGGTSTFLPMFRLDMFYPFGNFGITIYVFILAYAILRHRLMDIYLVFRRTVVYSLSAGVLTGIFIVLVLVMTRHVAELTGITSLAITAIAALFIAFIFEPLRNTLQSFVNKVFFKTTYDYYALIQKVSHELALTIELRTVYRLIVDTIIDSLKLKSARLLVAENDCFESVYSRSIHF